MPGLRPALASIKPMHRPYRNSALHSQAYVDCSNRSRVKITRAHLARIERENREAARIALEDPEKYGCLQEWAKSILERTPVCADLISSSRSTASPPAGSSAPGLSCVGSSEGQRRYRGVHQATAPTLFPMQPE